MAEHGDVLVLFLLVSLCTVLIEPAEAASRTRRDVNQADAKRALRARCVSCAVNGQLYDGHSRFQYEEGCNKYRCICRCDGSWECPAQYTENICERSEPAQRERHSQSSSSSSVSSSSPSTQQRTDGRCRSCIVNGKEHQGHSYFTHVHGCVTIDSCVCYCNGSWVCPQERARSTCGDGNLASSGEVSRAATWTVEIENSQSNSSSSSGSNSISSGSSSSSRESGSSSRESGSSVNRGSSSSINGGTSSRGSSGSSTGSSSLDVVSRDETEARRTDDRRLSYGGCRNCSVAGKIIAGNSYFEFEDGCRKMKQCSCYCNGSWNCPDRFVENTCRPDTDDQSKEHKSGCRSCSVKGKTFPGNEYFELTDGCIEYRNCICNCDGSWNCPDSGARNTCEQAGANVAALSGSNCRQCEVKGQIFPGNQYFQMTDGCIEYKNCICQCDGSWSCPDNGARNKCHERTEGIVDTSSCRSCEVYGSTFPGNKYFQIKHGCTEYRNCICHCNGTWQCPGDSAVNACDDKAVSSSSINQNEASRSSVMGCSSCLAYGNTFKGGDYFDVIDGCTSYRNCICRCNGSWVCNNRFATNICNNETRRVEESRNLDTERTDYRNSSRVTSAVSSSSNQCLFCNAKNKIVKGNSYFEVTEGCVVYTKCICRCDGSWECPSQFAKNICFESNQTSTGISPTTCSNCVAKGKIVRGNSNFELIDGCTRFTSCRCNCDGTWTCPEQRAQDICFSNATVSDNGCSLCQSSDGTVHQPNSQFKLTEDCIEYNCDCFCNGSWSCPGKKSRWICHDRCLQCDVNGRKVQNNTQFVHKTGCLEYTCNCHCNGSWSCPGNTVRNTCPVGVRDSCNKCRVSPTEIYEGESDFILKQSCLHYKCRCNCDGSYSCPGKDARNVCRGEVLGGCKSCVVSETEIHRGETDFTMRKECLHYECKCNCDGGWECPAEKVRNVCLGEVPGGCRACRVSETESYRANTVFDMRKDCIHYKCKCNCDGSWSCPGEDARDVCKGEIPGGCKSCMVAEEFYAGNSNFEMVKNCIHYKCRCNCNGSYSCPGQTARRVCQTGAVSDAPTCRSCKVSETEQFTGNTTFHLERGCTRYECECRCDGSWQCPPGKTRDVCVRDAIRTTSPTRCNSCKISKEVYPGNTSFKFTRGCSQFDCRCECSGRWSCDHKNRVNICLGGEQSTTERSLVSDANAVRTRQDITASGSNQVAVETSQRGSSFIETDIQSQEASNSQSQYATRTNRTRGATVISSSGSIDSNCRPCYADGRTIQPNGVFTLDRGCLQYKNCKCHCDGRWQCAEESNRCDVTQTPVVPQGERTQRTETQSSSSTLTRRREVDSSAWVFVDGVDTSYKTDDDKTGGGYLVKVDTKYSPTFSNRGQGSQRLEQLEVRPSSSEALSASGLSSSTFMTSGSSSDTSASASVEGKGTNQCLRCQVDTKTYPSGANFDMRRGCVVYKCLCLCSGSYRCRLTSDNECSVQNKQNTCSNCLYQGMVFPGNMGFTVREGCEEKQCNCNCDGTHACHSTKPIPGCTGATAYAPGYTGNGNFYPAHGGLIPASTGYITNTGRVVYQSTCTTCIDGSSGPVVYHTPVQPAFGEGGGGFVQTEHRFSVDQGIPKETCSGCFVDGQNRNGNSTFAFEKDCIEFDCYCACGGSWKCAGRLSIGCTPGFAPDTVPHTTGCRSCNVQGTEYPANARFSLRQGCHEYQCSCNCDGGWSCPAQHPVNLCPSAPTRPVRGNVLDPQIIREDTYVADQSQAAELKVATDTCYDCEVRGVTYRTQSKFFLREGCIQRICECHCNKSWSCYENTVDICKIAASESSSVNSGQCKDCRVGSDVYVSENNFQTYNGCYQQNCYCYCNGTHECPKERVRNICNPDIDASAGERTDSNRQSRVGIQQSVLTKENGDVIMAGKIPGCKECLVDGQKIEALSTFVKQLGCYESLCQCQCNGNSVCPPSASVNTCELSDKLPMGERKGCQVGRRTHYTRVFAHIENCIQRTCVCHDNGEWSCKRTANDIRVC